MGVFHVGTSTRLVGSKLATADLKCAPPYVFLSNLVMRSGCIFDGDSLFEFVAGVCIVHLSSNLMGKNDILGNL